MKPGNTPKRRAVDPELLALITALDRRAARAVLTIIDITAEVGRERIRRLIEAVATLVAVGPRRTRSVGRSRA